MSGDIPATFDANRGHCPSCKAEIKITPNEEERRGLEEDSRLRVLKAFEQLLRHWLRDDITKVGGVETHAITAYNTAGEDPTNISQTKENHSEKADIYEFAGKVTHHHDHE
ncbi:hypothetical protein AVEN_207259-1 [Araneus ventricosus]|uniref:Uncharacterized protein n=1 Tax=Araneus ventricosus TaxID=182803 RepID=A0A4Y2DBF5_ARAVE|nr:hypothetical protein AVEN_207259-1 [Araneus ventricosus]